MSKSSVLRWAIGSPDRPRSSTWRLWGNKKGDIYVAVRILGGITKASFHRDGRCQIGFTSEYAETASRRFGTKSRHWQHWQLPVAQAVRILQVLVPRSELRLFTDKSSGNVIWLPTPPKESVSVVSIFITAPNFNDIELPSGHHAAMVVGKVRTSTCIAWVVSTHHPIDAVLAKLFDDERTKLKHILGTARLPQGTRATLWESKEDYDRHVLELACS